MTLTLQEWLDLTQEQTVTPPPKPSLGDMSSANTLGSKFLGGSVSDLPGYEPPKPEYNYPDTFVGSPLGTPPPALGSAPPVTQPASAFEQLPGPLSAGYTPPPQQRIESGGPTISFNKPEEAPQFPLGVSPEIPALLQKASPGGDPESYKRVIEYILAQPDPEAALRGFLNPRRDIAGEQIAHGLNAPFVAAGNLGESALRRWQPVPGGPSLDQLINALPDKIGPVPVNKPADVAVTAAGQALPYIFADVLTGGAANVPLIAATAAGQGAEVSSAYGAGDVSGQQAALQLGIAIAPVLGPELARLGIHTPEAIRGFLTEDPAGIALIERAKAIHANELGQFQLPGEIPSEAQRAEAPATSAPEAPAAPEPLSSLDQGNAARYVRARDQGLIPDSATTPEIDAHARYEAVLNDRTMSADQKAPLLTELAKAFQEQTPPEVARAEPVGAGSPAPAPAGLLTQPIAPQAETGSGGVEPPSPPPTATGALEPPQEPPGPPATTQPPSGGDVLPPVNQKFIAAMQQAVLSPSERARLLTEGRSRQAGGIAGVAKGGGSFEERLAKAGGAAKGQILPDFAAIGEKFTPDEMSQLTGQIDQALQDQRISSFQWKTTGDVFQRVMMGGKEPQPAERRLLAQVFGPEFEKAIPQGPDKWRLWHEVTGLLGVPQALSASFDLSAPLRQGAVLGSSHPILWAKTFPAMIKAAGTEAGTLSIGVGKFKRSFQIGDGAAQVMEQVGKNSWVKGVGELDGYGFEEVGGHLSSLDQLTAQGQREGQYASLNKSFISHAVQAIPGVRQSERGFVVMLNKLRADVYASEASRMWESGIRDTAQYSALAKTINHATGWGDFKVGQITDGVNAFFSPRNLVARFQVVTDPFTQPGSLLDPSARQLAAKNLVAFAAYNTAALALLSATGLAKVELNPLSTDWGKARRGDTRLDFMAGYGPMVRLVARLERGEIKGPTGVMRDADRKGLVEDFLRGKMGPVPSVVWDVWSGKNGIGQPADLTSQAGIKAQVYNHFVPFVAQDVTEAIKKSDALSAAAAGPFAFFGGGVQTYAQPSRDILEARDAAAKGAGYADYADAQAKLGPNAAAAKFASDPAVQEAQKALDAIPSPFKDALHATQAQQALLDQQLESGAMSPSQWRDARKQLSANQAGRLAILKQQAGSTDKPTGDPVLDGYFKVFKDYSDPATGYVADATGLQDALDAYQGSLTPEEQAHLDANTGTSQVTPKVQAYRDATKAIADSGYWRIQDAGYARLQKTDPETAPYASWGDFKAALIQSAMKRGNSYPQAVLTVGRLPVVLQFDRTVSVARKKLLADHPAIVKLLDEWGFKTPSRRDLPALAGVP